MNKEQITAEIKQVEDKLADLRKKLKEEDKKFNTNNIFVGTKLAADGFLDNPITVVTLSSEWNGPFYLLTPSLRNWNFTTYSSLQKLCDYLNKDNDNFKYFSGKDRYTIL